MGKYQSLAGCNRSGEEPAADLMRAVARLREHGFTPSPGACYIREDGSVYASSVESLGPGTFGHPACSVEIDRRGQISTCPDKPRKP